MNNWTKCCKKVAKHFGWTWDGHSASPDDPYPTAMFHDGYFPLVIPMRLVCLAARTLDGTS